MYRANRSVMLEATKTWRSSGLYREESERITLESEKLSNSPWDDTVYEEEIPFKPAFRWGSPEDVSEGPSFEDVARPADLEEVYDIVEYISDGDGSVVDFVTEMIENNEGRVLYMGRQGDTGAFAVGFSEGSYFVSELALDEPLLDEGLISIRLVADNAPAPEAPVVPGFTFVEQKLWEVLHASEILKATLQEFGDEGAELIGIINEFSESLTSVLVEVAADDGTLTENELSFIYETFAGVFAGLHEEVLKITA